MGADLSGWRVVGAVVRAEQGVFGGMPDWPDWVAALHTSADSKPEQNHKCLGCSVLTQNAISLTVSAETSVLTGNALRVFVVPQYLWQLGTLKADCCSA